MWRQSVANSVSFELYIGWLEMLKYLTVVICVAWLGSLFGCTRKPKVVKIDQLSFPVVRIFETSTNSIFVEAVSNKEDLSYMSVGYGSFDTNPPIVIDSNANFFDMKDIKMCYFGLGAMISPTSRQRFQFTLLQRKETGIEASRNLIVKYLMRGRDEEHQKLRCERIRQASTMEEMMQVIRE